MYSAELLLLWSQLFCYLGLITVCASGWIIQSDFNV